MADVRRRAALTTEFGLLHSSGRWCDLLAVSVRFDGRAVRGIMGGPGPAIEGTKEKGGCAMGDKGGKKDKQKDQKQKASKHDQEAKRKLDKQPKSVPR
jgi:hypothetical protein